MSNKSKPTKDGQQPDKLEQIKLEIDATKQKMLQNMDSVLARGEKIEQVQSKAAMLEDQAQVFRKKAGEAKSKMCWQMYRLYILIFIFVVIVGIILWLAIAPPWKK